MTVRPPRIPVRETVRRVLPRVLAVAAGLAISWVAFLVGVLTGLDTGCLSEEAPTAFCPDREDLAKTLQFVALAVGSVAPTAGAIAYCMTSRARWLAAGLGAGVLMVFASLLIASGLHSGFAN